jgi:hypothetical protein
MEIVNDDDYIKSLFVDYELALKMRDIGFNRPCLAVFRSGSLYSYLSGYLCDGNWDKNLSVGDENQWVSAPTLDQILDWFRDVHGIDINYELGENPTNYYPIQTMTKHKIGYSGKYQPSHWKDSTREAKLIGINEALKYLNL